MAILKNTYINDTGYLQLPSGTTAERPFAPAPGHMRWNTTIGGVEVHNGSEWITIPYATNTPAITTSGLTVNLDAGIATSYPGTGTTWTDLSGNGYNQTLLNGIGYSTSYGGSLTFDGVNDYILLPNTMIPSAEVTIELVCSNTNLGVYSSIIAGGTSGNQDLNVHLPWSDGTVYWDAGRPFQRISKLTTTGERTGIHHWVFTKNSSTGVMNIYLDGSLWHTGSGLTNTIPTLTSLSLGRYDNASAQTYYHKGNVSIFRVYNRAISASEVLFNFNATKSRFGL